MTKIQKKMIKSKRTLNEPYRDSPKRARSQSYEEQLSNQYEASMEYDDSIFDRDQHEIQFEENIDQENMSNNGSYVKNSLVRHSTSQDEIYSINESENCTQTSCYKASLQRIEKRNLSNSLGEIGHIKSITLQNFMCHTNFHLDFGPRVNFIVGQNGSKL